MKNSTPSEIRMFKLSTGKEVNTAEVEKQIESVCHYVKYVLVAGSGEEQPVALIFPDKQLLSHPDYLVTPEEGCFCPRNINELSKCMRGCLTIANNRLEQKLKCAAIVNSDTPGNMEEYKEILKKMYAGNAPSEDEVYIVKF